MWREEIIQMEQKKCLEKQNLCGSGVFVKGYYCGHWQSKGPSDSCLIFHYSRFCSLLSLAFWRSFGAQTANQKHKEGHGIINQSATEKTSVILLRRQFFVIYSLSLCWCVFYMLFCFSIPQIWSPYYHLENVQEYERYARVHRGINMITCFM